MNSTRPKSNLYQRIISVDSCINYINPTRRYHSNPRKRCGIKISNTISRVPLDEISNQKYYKINRFENTLNIPNKPLSFKHNTEKIKKYSNFENKKN